MYVHVHIHLDVAKLALTKCVSKGKAHTGRKNEHENGLVYDFEFIEDYSVPAQMIPSTGQDLQLNTADDAQWLLIDNEDEDDVSSTAKQDDVLKRPLWDPRDYYAPQHPLALMVVYNYMYMYITAYCFFLLS